MSNALKTTIYEPYWSDVKNLGTHFKKFGIWVKLWIVVGVQFSFAMTKRSVLVHRFNQSASAISIDWAELGLDMLAKLKRHLMRCFATGIVAILPVAGLLFFVVYFENLIAGSWLKTRGFYFFGLGILLAVGLLYLLGLVLSSVLGRWFFKWIDRWLDRLPLLGELYRTLKQLVGYGEGPGGMFKRVVWVAFDHPPRWELGLVTESKSSLAQGRTAVFVPNAPSPTTGRLIYVEEAEILPTDLRVNEALQLLVSIGGVVPSQDRFEI